MAQLPVLVIDLALILLLAGITTIICKKLEQPIVLGYIIAGFFIGPNFKFFYNIASEEAIAAWSEIGVIILLFALGLEFSFYKLKKVGGAAFIATFILMAGTMILGFGCGMALGWTNMDSIFLGAMLSMSSTAIIVKNFEDSKKPKGAFQEFVVGILVVEDIVSILMIVILSTVAKTRGIPDVHMLFMVIVHLLFYLVLWFVVGIYIIPPIFKKTHNIMNNETLLVVSLGLCFGMTILVTRMGVSAALGAFMMGSFIAETPDGERIQKLVAPVKDLFGAIFFVSVGMMVDLSIVWQYMLPLLLIVLAATVGKFAVGFVASVAAGYDVKDSVHSSFSLAPIGEFSFIIASLGIAEGAIDTFLYPIIVAAAAITIFLAPYCMAQADFWSKKVSKLLPENMVAKINSNALNSHTGDLGQWQSILRSFIIQLVVNLTLLLAISWGANTYLEPYVRLFVPFPFSNMVVAAVSFCCMLPFLTALLANRSSKPKVFLSLWFKNKANHIPLLFLLGIKLVVTGWFVYYFFAELLELHQILAVIATFLTISVVSSSKWLFGEYLRMESNFLVNLNNQHLLKYRKEHNITDQQKAITLFDEQLFLAKYRIDKFAPQLEPVTTLAKLSLAQQCGCNAIQVTNDHKIIDMPAGECKIKAGSEILLLGEKEQIALFPRVFADTMPGITEIMPLISLRKFVASKELNTAEKPFLPCAIPLDYYQQLIGKTIMSSGIRNNWHCLILGIERGYYIERNPDVATILQKDDILWVLGKQKMINQLVINDVI